MSSAPHDGAAPRLHHPEIAVPPHSRPRSRHPLDPVLETGLVGAAQAGNAAARAQLVAAFAPFIRAISHEYRASSEDEQAVFTRAGAVGLLTALDRYDTARGTPFRAYAAWWVRHGMQRVADDHARPAAPRGEQPAIPG
ncbi:MAG TPA: sigma factor [Thermoleophilaceae bacterium]|nr:sigma factor [Thermoleophilaceae bacterium]